MGPPDHWAFRATHPTHPTGRVTRPPAGWASGPHLPAQIPQEASEVQSTRPPHPKTLKLGTSRTEPCFPSDGLHRLEPPLRLPSDSPQISSRTGVVSLSTDWGPLLTHDRAGLTHQNGHPRTGLCSSFRLFTPRPTPNRRATPQNKVALAPSDLLPLTL